MKMTPCKLFYQTTTLLALLLITNQSTKMHNFIFDLFLKIYVFNGNK